MTPPGSVREAETVFKGGRALARTWQEVPQTGIHVLPLPEDTTTVILASDGYPVLKETVASSEQALQDLLAEDPLLFRKYLSTKGVAAGNVSYDDRAHVKIRVNKPN